MSFNLEEFGNQLKLMREQLNISQEKLSVESGISKSTIYRLENGNNMPSLEVLEILSIFYNKDLIKLISESKDNEYKTLQFYIDNLENHIYKFDINKIPMELLRIKELQTDTNYALNKKIEQNILFYEGIFEFKKKNFDKSFDFLVQSILINNNSFDLKNYNNYLYKDKLHIRTLMTIALTMFYLDYKKEFKNILLDIIQKYDEKDSLKTDILHNVSIMYDRFNDLDKSYKFLNLELHFVEKRLDFKNLPLIYFTKGALDLKLDNKTYLSNFSKALNLCDIFNNENLKKQIYHKLSLYNITV